ncbi:MAG: tRNA uridine-5-carboxymethylaminomethyl(34) synthesis GTPase MnmE [Desulfobacteraceae bacterium]|jgi:tRNA modification GTPase|nr:tRNA uridine-5-carboxymethylaminomethyl(34) synthesis GTPase MnmE [Desulfobacteraceae bacterium]
MSPDQDTIAAIATPIGQAGIGIIRVSGPLSPEIAGKIFRPKNPTPLLRSHHLYLGHLFEPSSGNAIDEVLFSFMRGPHTYTREDVLEINSHSGYALLSKILEILLGQGARLATPGEFTLRAFLNGRIDLTQAEAVIDIINSQSERGLYLASQQVQGSFKEEIEGLRQKAINILAQAEVAIDFPEEGTDVVFGEEETRGITEDLIKPIEALIEAHESRIWVDGINTVIAGRVNAGKSSLLNRLLNEQRAIVTPIPGTTRDIIESTINIEGIPIRLMDTAGFQRVNDEVERLGINLTKQKLKESDFVLIVIDQSRPLGQDDLDTILQSKGKKALIVINKIDLPSKLGERVDSEALSLFPSVKISALTGQGLDQLKKAMKGCILEGRLDTTSSHAVPNIRHRHALNNALQFFKDAEHITREEAPMEIIALELRSGLDALGEITGETTSEDVLDSIFSQFCLGK